MQEALESERELGIFHFLAKLEVQEVLTGRTTKGVTRLERAGRPEPSKAGYLKMEVGAEGERAQWLLL